MNRSRRSLLIACSVILVCLAIIVGGTFALFTDTVQVRHHLKAGKLDITLIRTNLKTTTLDNTTGYLVDKDNPVDKNFSDTTVNSTDNIFDITDSLLVVPDTSFEAEMFIGNNIGTDTVDPKLSNVAYKYWIDIVFDDETSEAFAKQLKVTVTTANGSINGKYLNETGLSVGSEEAPIGTLALGGSANFTVKVEFVDDYTTGITFDNDDVMGEEVKFDLVVNAVQVTRS